MIITIDNYEWALTRLDHLYISINHLSNEEKAELTALAEDVRLYEEFVKYGKN